MTYLHKKSADGNRVVYEYGKEINIHIGTIEFDIDQLAELGFNERTIKLKFYNGNSFCWHTGQALQAIAKFIRDDYFPDEYIRATH